MADEQGKASWWKKPLTLPLWAVVLVGVAGIALGAASGGGSTKKSASADELASLREKNADLRSQVSDLQGATTELTRQPDTTTTTLSAEALAAFLDSQRKNSILADGIYEVGKDVNSGRWRTGGAADVGALANCYYAVLNSPDTFDIVTNNNTTGPAIVDLPAGKFFETSGCQDWTHD